MIMSKSRIVLIVVAVIAIFTFGYYTADNIWERKYLQFKLTAEKEYSTLLEQKIEADQANRQRVNSLEKEYLNELDIQKREYEKIIALMHDNFHPSGVSECPASGDGVPGTSDDTTNLVCYTKSELHKRISESLAITKRADELAVKYNSLLKIVKGDEK